MRILRLSIVAFLGLALAGCSSGGGSAASSNLGKMHISMSGGSAHSKVTALSSSAVAFPTNRKRCYAVNVTGPDITSSAPSCGPAIGVLSGFAEANTDEQVTVAAPIGSDRTIEVYMLLMAVGDDSACPIAGAELDRSQINNMYLLGEIEHQDIAEDTAVDLTPVYAGASENIISQLGLSASCAVDPSPSATDNFTILNGANWISTSSNMLATSFDDNGMNVAGDPSANDFQWQTQQANYSIQGDFTTSSTFTLNRVDGTADAGVRMVLRFNDDTFIHFTVQVQNDQVRVWRAVYKSYDPNFDATNDPVQSGGQNLEDWSDWMPVSPGSKVKLVVSRFGENFVFAYDIDGVQGDTFGTFPSELDLSSYTLGDSVTPMLTTYDKSSSETIDVSYSGWQVIGYIYDTALATIPAYFQPF